MNNLLIVLTGKTASGKDTVAARLLEKNPQLRKVITTTSRPLRTGEVDGKDYNFISKDKFNEKIANGGFIEYVEYAGNFYGTEKKELEGQNLIWRIDPSRAGQVRDLIKDREVIVIYLTVDDSVVLKRLRDRGLSEEEINARMKQDANFWQRFKDKYDYVVENVPDRLDQTLDKIRQIGVKLNFGIFLRG